MRNPVVVRLFGVRSRFRSLVSCLFIPPILPRFRVIRIDPKYLLALVILASAFIAYSMRGANMLIYIFFSTVEILLLIDLPTPGSLTDVWARVVNVFVGALIGVVVVFLFMRPSQKKESSSCHSDGLKGG